jgi:anti-sigma factor RsiW
MNLQFEKRPSEPVNSGMIDRLVDGSLPDGERHTILLRLDTEPDGWRRCALAFLEAQAWREAFAPLSESAAPVSTLPNPRSAVSKSKPARIAVRWTAAAASLLAAFALGWSVKHVEQPNVPRELAREVTPAPTISSKAALPEAIAGAEEKRAAPELSPSSLYVEALVKSLQQKGYSAERETTNVTMKFQDGKERKIQAQEIRLHYAGGRTY